MAKCSVCGKNLSFWNSEELNGKDYCPECLKNKQKGIDKLNEKTKEKSIKEPFKSINPKTKLQDKLVSYSFFKWCFLMIGILCGIYAFVTVLIDYNEANSTFKDTMSTTSDYLKGLGLDAYQYSNGEYSLRFNVFFTANMGIFMISLFLLLLAIFFSLECNYLRGILEKV